MAQKKYFVPPDMREKEKIVGGKFTLNQAGWIVMGFVLGFAVVICLYRLSLIFALIVGILVFLSFSGAFAFYTVNDISLFRYLYLRKLHVKKTKHLPYSK